MDESMSRALFFCNSASLIWEHNPFWSHIREVGEAQFVIMFKHIAGKVSKKDLCLFAALSRAAWTSRNKAIFDDHPHCPQLLVAIFVNYVEQYNGYSRRVHSNQASCPSIFAKKWKKPNGGVVKINVDAAFFQDNSMGLGAVARNAEGQIPFTAARRVAGRWDVNVAEAAACLFGVWP
uniref:RNase H type-1 domain-containing protein n=1 Tax=Chenopodium quinoa TaxID=63459 RepID=A0A803ML39_CHEQI